LEFVAFLVESRHLEVEIISVLLAFGVLFFSNFYSNGLVVHVFELGYIFPKETGYLI
jgi:hypothetical protein